jgi:PAS domain-containing protein
MTSKDHHADIVTRATHQVQGLYDASPQAMYIYMDDEHKSCSKSFAALLGYKSPAEWQAIVDDIPAAFVADKSIDDVIGAFQACVRDGVAGTFDITWRRKDGKTVPSRTTFVPMEVDGHRMALHFIEPAGR